MSKRSHNTISPEKLQSLLNEQADITIIDVLPPDHFAAVHLPGAKNGCVFFVSFLDVIARLLPDKDTKTVVYGSSSRSHDATMALDKLQRAGYSNLSILTGGLEAWNKQGYMLEGQATQEMRAPQTCISIPKGTFHIDVDHSSIEWAGRNPAGRHFGTVNITHGFLRNGQGELTGSIEIDMNSIKNVNLEGNELQPVLEAHLKSDDFFFTSMFARSTLHILEAERIEPGYQTCPNMLVKGELELRGVSKEIEFAASLNVTENNDLILEAHFDIDRTRWNIIYGSTRFFEHLGMHKVADMISIQFFLVTNKS